VGDSIVIIIDQWEWYYPNPELGYSESAGPKKKLPSMLPNRIINFIDNQNIHTAVLASYMCSEELYSNKIWYSNRQSIKQVTGRSKVLDYHTYKKYKQKTIDIILDYVNPNIFQIAMREEKELETYLLSYPEIKNIFVSGIAWEICVKIRPLGYVNIYEKFCLNSDRRVLVSTDCVLTCNGEIPELDTQWISVGNNIYEYCPN